MTANLVNCAETVSNSTQLSYQGDLIIIMQPDSENASRVLREGASGVLLPISPPELVN